MIPDFVPISVAGVLPEASTSGAPSGTAPGGQIEIVVGVATVRIPTLVDEPTLRRVLAALKSLR